MVFIYCCVFVVWHYCLYSKLSFGGYKKWLSVPLLFKTSALLLSTMTRCNLVSVFSLMAKKRNVWGAVMFFRCWLLPLNKLLSATHIIRLSGEILRLWIRKRKKVGHRHHKVLLNKISFWHITDYIEINAIQQTVVGSNAEDISSTSFKLKYFINYIKFESVMIS